MELPRNGAFHVGLPEVARAPGRWLIVLAGVLVLTVVVTMAVPGLRHSLLRSIGHSLVAEDAPAKGDLIIISTDVMGAGILEAADLVKSGVAQRVAIFDRPPNRVQLEFARRGIESLDVTKFSMQLLDSLGLHDVVVIPAVVGTEDEGKVLQRWCVANSVRSIVFVSTPDHSRRTRRVLTRSLGPLGIKVTERYSKYSDFDPDSWWLSREGQRTCAVELEKLLLDVLRHPFS